MKNDETERMEVQQNSEEEAAGQSERPSISPAVIHRLPRYYRYLRELLTQGRTRISSGELAGMMRVTASQIRQDLNCFGGFGQQGYGYNVNYLYARISDLRRARISCRHYRCGRSRTGVGASVHV